MKYNFVKEDGRWYVLLPEWKGPKANLEMVAGADEMLHWYSGGDSKCTLEVSFEPFTETDYFSTLTYLGDAKEQYGEGAFYRWNDKDTIWLCDVMLFVFGEFPKLLYVKMI